MTLRKSTNRTAVFSVPVRPAVGMLAQAGGSQREIRCAYEGTGAKRHGQSNKLLMSWLAALDDFRNSLICEPPDAAV